MSWNIDFGPKVTFGAGSRKLLGEKLKEFGCKTVLLIHDEAMEELGYVKELKEITHASGVELLTYAPKMGEPTPDRVDTTADYARENKVDGLVALGGGATIDITKLVAKILANGGKAEDYLGYTNTAGTNEFKPVVVLPTTAGTGAEITFGLICSNSKGEKKASKHNTHLVIEDPEYTYNLPKGITANTGIDAFAHCVEVMSNTNAIPNKMADTLCKEGVHLSYKWLPVAYKDGKNEEARTNMSYAAMLGGYCLRLRKASFGHSIANQVCNEYHYPHGFGVCIGIEPFVRYNVKMNEKWTRMMAEALEISCPAEGEDLTETGKKIVKAVDELLKSVGEKSMKELGIPFEFIDKMVAGIKVDDKWKVVPPEAVPDFDKMREAIEESWDF